MVLIASSNQFSFFTVDGGPDENPRYQKVIRVEIHHFLRYDFDSLFIATNAPGRSAFNIVERKMVPLSKELTGTYYMITTVVI